MVNYVTDFSKFVKDFNDKTYDINFKVGEEDYSLKYRELTSQEEAKLAKEFEAWFVNAYKSEDKDKLREASLQQYRYFKMIKNTLTGLNTFDEFLALPRTVIGAFILGVEEDMLKRYPHIRKQLDMAMGNL